MHFFVTDGEVELGIDADTEWEAAQKYVAGGDYATDSGGGVSVPNGCRTNKTRNLFDNIRYCV